MHYLPLGLPFFSLLAGILAVLILLLQINALRFAYERLGLSSGTALLLLIGSLLGSYFNIPVWSFPERQVVSGQEISVFGTPYVIPYVVDWPGTVIAINVGGAVIPICTSLYLLMRNSIWVKGAIGTACVAALCYAIARPVPGLGIALPTLLPAGITAIVALFLSREQAAPIAYVAGSLGTLIGADLLN
ncbi:MAG: DUF1614 domain-containing protein, partial [Proteobacteria bacterium]|nr:DUF1614 domain-containing protein [Pseudomonadota bacterium]